MENSGFCINTTLFEPENSSLNPYNPFHQNKSQLPFYEALCEEMHKGAIAELLILSNPAITLLFSI